MKQQGREYVVIKHLTFCLLNTMTSGRHRPWIDTEVKIWILIKQAVINCSCGCSCGWQCGPPDRVCEQDALLWIWFCQHNSGSKHWDRHQPSWRLIRGGIISETLLILTCPQNLSGWVCFTTHTSEFPYQPCRECFLFMSSLSIPHNFGRWTTILQYHVAYIVETAKLLCLYSNCIKLWIIGSVSKRNREDFVSANLTS